MSRVLVPISFPLQTAQHTLPGREGVASGLLQPPFLTALLRISTIFSSIYL